MFAAEFEYYRATTVAEAGALLKQHPGAKLLAGGHSLIPLLKLRLAAPAAVIDIGRVAELKGITADSGMVRVDRALTTHAELASHPVIREYCSALADAAAQVGDPAVRNRGTIGGNVAHADPASDLPTVLTALGARFSVVGPGGSRTIEAASFFQGMMATALGEHDLLVAVEVPSHAGQGMAYVEVRASSVTLRRHRRRGRYRRERRQVHARLGRRRRAGAAARAGRLCRKGVGRPGSHARRHRERRPAGLAGSGRRHPRRSLRVGRIPRAPSHRSGSGERSRLQQGRGHRGSLQFTIHN